MESLMLTIRLFVPQAEALLKAAHLALKGLPQTPAETRDRAPLERAVEAIQAAIDGAQPSPLDRDLDRLTTTLYSLKLGVLRDWAMQRLIYLHRRIELWRAGAELPWEIQAKILQIQALNQPGWRGEIEQLLQEHGLRIDLPDAGDYHVLNLPRRKDPEGGME